MTKLRTDKKAHTFRGAAALITAAFLVLLFTGCPNANGSKPVTPKYKITFSVDGSNGNLTAAVDGKTITSGTEVEKGKKVTFTAAPNTGYKVKGWTLDGKAVNGTDNSYQLKIEKAVDVKVSFVALHTVTFNVEGENGTLKATVNTSEINSGNTVEHGKTVTFTATPTAGYVVKEWKLDGKAITEVGTNTEYKHTVTQPCTITVSFEFGKAILTLDADKLTIKVTAKTADGSAVQVEGCNEPTLASGVKTELHAKGATVILKGYITELTCSGTGSNKPLTAINVQGLTALQVLKCEENQLSNLNVQGLTSLKHLDCSDNQLTALNVQGFVALKELLCNSNKLTELNVHKCFALQELNCTINQLTVLNVSGCTALKVLLCCGNQLNAEVFTKILNDLPAREAGESAQALLYAEMADIDEGNCKDFTTPKSLKNAFEGAKDVKHWEMKKLDTYGRRKNI